MANRITGAAMVARRRVLLGAGAAVVAMPQVSRAQTAIWRFQSAWASRDIFHEFAVDYAKKVEEMTGGRLKFDVLVAGSVVPAFQMQDAVHAGILDGGHGVCDIWYRKHKAASLFGSPPSFGWDAHGMLAWFYSGGGQAACSLTLWPTTWVRGSSRRPTSISSASWNQGTRDDR